MKKNKPNSKPIQTQFITAKPIQTQFPHIKQEKFHALLFTCSTVLLSQAKGLPQTQFKANQTQFITAKPDQTQFQTFCCRGLGLGEHEAEDVASEVFLAAYKSLGRYRGQAELGTWLWRIAYNKAVSYLRKNRRYVEFYGRADEWLAESKDKAVGAELESRQEAEIVWRAVKRLRPEWAAAIVLFYREEKNISEIAKIMGKRKNTIKTYLFRGRKRLKEIIGPVVGEDADVD